MGTIIGSILVDYWARSLLEWGDKVGLQLKFGEPDSKGSSNELIVDALKLDKETTELLASLDINTATVLSKTE